MHVLRVCSSIGMFAPRHVYGSVCGNDRRKDWIGVLKNEIKKSGWSLVNVLLGSNHPSVLGKIYVCV